MKMKQLQSKAIQQLTTLHTAATGPMITVDMLTVEDKKYKIFPDSFYHDIVKQKLLIGAVLHARINYLHLDEQMIIQSMNNTTTTNTNANANANSAVAPSVSGEDSNSNSNSNGWEEEMILSPPTSNSASSTPNGSNSNTDRKRIRKRRRSVTNGVMMSTSTRVL